MGNENLALIEMAMSTALGAAAAGVGGVVSGQIASQVTSDVGSAFVKSALKDGIDNQMQDYAMAVFSSISGDFLPVLGGRPDRAFFKRRRSSPSGCSSCRRWTSARASTGEPT